MVLKKLKDDYLTDTGIRSRFKREFNITKSLQDAVGIIQVFEFDEGSCSYTMEYAETTLDKYVKTFDLSDDIKLNCIRQILHIMTEVHKRNIIHRDISARSFFFLPSFPLQLVPPFVEQGIAVMVLLNLLFILLLMIKIGRFPKKHEPTLLGMSAKKIFPRAMRVFVIVNSSKKIKF